METAKWSIILLNSIYDIDTMDLMFRSTAYILLGNLQEDKSNKIKLFSFCKFHHNIENAIQFLS